MYAGCCSHAEAPRQSPGRRLLPTARQYVELQDRSLRGQRTGERCRPRRARQRQEPPPRRQPHWSVAASVKLRRRTARRTPGLPGGHRVHPWSHGKCPGRRRLRHPPTYASPSDATKSEGISCDPRRRVLPPRALAFKGYSPCSPRRARANRELWSRSVVGLLISVFGSSRAPVRVWPAGVHRPGRRAGTARRGCRRGRRAGSGARRGRRRRRCGRTRRRRGAGRSRHPGRRRRGGCGCGRRWRRRRGWRGRRSWRVRTAAAAAGRGRRRRRRVRRWCSALKPRWVV